MAKQRMHGPALEARRARVLKGWCEGKTQLQLAEQEKVVVGQISRDLAACWAKLAPQSEHDAKAALWELLAKVAYGEAELLAAWERSKQPREKKKGKKVEPGTGPGKKVAGRKEAETITEGRDGNPRFWERLESLWQFKARLLGLLVTKVAPTDPSGEKPYELPISDDDKRSIAAAALARLGLSVAPAGGGQPADDGGPAVAGAGAGDDPGGPAA